MSGSVGRRPAKGGGPDKAYIDREAGTEAARWIAMEVKPYVWPYISLAGIVSEGRTRGQ